MQLSDSAFKKLLIALSLYLTSLFAANTLGLKIMPFLFGTHLSVAVFSFPVVFLMTDVIGEVYGKKMAKYFVLAGFISVALFIGYSFLSLAMPWSEAGAWAHDSYNTIFGMSVRIAVASLVAFVVAEYQDVVAFFFFKNYFKEAGFWLRSNLSNIWSQFLDSLLFMVIAFGGAGVYTWPVIFQIIIAWWVYKVLMGFLYTPLSYLGIRLLKDTKSEDEN